DEIAVSQRNGTIASVAPSVARDQLDHVRLSEDPGHVIATFGTQQVIQLQNQQLTMLHTGESQSNLTGGHLGYQQRSESPDRFMTGGTHILRHQEMSPAQRSLLMTINENVQTLEQAKRRLDIGPPTERLLPNLGTDEVGRKYIRLSVTLSLGSQNKKDTEHYHPP
ncbi:unnamed protein product, partial [Protopolystoma xenopodis]